MTVVSYQQADKLGFVWMLPTLLLGEGRPSPLLINLPVGADIIRPKRFPRGRCARRELA